MQVKLLEARATANGSENRGDIVTVSDAEGVRMIEAGQAEPVRTVSPERAVKAPRVEKASK
jgi:hypothetical protein